MSLTSLNVPPMAGRVPMGQQGGRLLQFGQFAFSTTDITGELPVLMDQVDALLVLPAQAERTVRSYPMQLGSVSATSEFTVVVPVAGTITAVHFGNKNTIAAHASNIWAMGAVNKTQTLTVADSTAAANTTNSTGGSGLTAYTDRQLTLSAVAGALTVAANDVLQFTLTKSASASQIDAGYALIEVSTPQGVYCVETVLGPAVVTDGTITVDRAPGGPSGAVYQYLAIGR